MRLGFRKKKQTERPSARKSVIFIHKGFWAQVAWIAFLLAVIITAFGAKSVSSLEFAAV